MIRLRRSVLREIVIDFCEILAAVLVAAAFVFALIRFAADTWGPWLIAVLFLVKLLEIALWLVRWVRKRAARWRGA